MTSQRKGISFPSLSPQSTGSNGSGDAADSPPDSSNESSAAEVKKRRQTAIYPHVNSSNKPQKPFSRSAAKRQSVMALGSIEHLQYFFTKAGIKAKKNPLLDKPHYGLVPAIGGEGMSVRTNNPSISSISDLNLPPTPVIPAPPPTNAFTHVKTEVDSESLLPGVIEDLAAVSRAWHLDEDDEDTLSPDDTPRFDVLTNLQITTRAIRSIRNYLLYFPDESTTVTREENFRSNRLTPSAAASSSASARAKSPVRTGTLPPGGVSVPAQPQQQQQQQQQKDPLTLIRRSALEVLTVLRELEEKARLPLTDDAYDAQSDGGGSHGGKDSSSNSGSGGGSSGGSHSRVASPSGRPVELEESGGLGLHEVDADTSVAFSFVRVQGRDKSVPVWEDLDADEVFSDDEEKEKRERWDERLVVGSGWLYKQDVTMKNVEKERAIVREYVDVVDEILFHGDKKDESGKRKERGWVKERRRLMNKGGKRRASAGDIGGKTKGLGIFMGDPGFGRRVSTGMLPNIMGGSSISQEPAHMGGIEEGDEGAEEPAESHSSQSTDDPIDEDDLPEWARKDVYEGRDLDRAHALIHFLLPPSFHEALSPSTPSSSSLEDVSSSPSSSLSSRTAFLDCLSSGQLLCIAYNAGVRKSKKPWGYVNQDSIHDIIALEQAEEDNEKKKTGWTFRRTDNLRLWAGSLKLRYMLPIILPTHVIPITPSASSSSTGTGSGSRPGTPKPGNISLSATNTPLIGNSPMNSPLPYGQRFNSTEPPLLFDAKVVARKDEGWDMMLQAVLLSWMWKVVDERRGEKT